MPYAIWYDVTCPTTWRFYRDHRLLWRHFTFCKCDLVNSGSFLHGLFSCVTLQKEGPESKFWGGPNPCSPRWWRHCTPLQIAPCKESMAFVNRRRRRVCFNAAPIGVFLHKARLSTRPLPAFSRTISRRLIDIDYITPRTFRQRLVVAVYDM